MVTSVHLEVEEQEPTKAQSLVEQRFKVVLDLATFGGVWTTSHPGQKDEEDAFQSSKGVER